MLDDLINKENLIYCYEDKTRKSHKFIYNSIYLYYSSNEFRRDENWHYCKKNHRDLLIKNGYIELDNELTDMWGDSYDPKIYFKNVDIYSIKVDYSMGISDFNDLLYVYFNIYCIDKEGHTSLYIDFNNIMSDNIRTILSTMLNKSQMKELDAYIKYINTLFISNRILLYHNKNNKKKRRSYYKDYSRMKKFIIGGKERCQE